MKSRKGWILGMAAAVVLGAAAVGLFFWLRGPSAGEGHDSEATTQAETTETAAAPGVTWKPEQIQAAGLQTAPLAFATLQPETRLFGWLQEDPAETFTLRATVAGTLSVRAPDAWPRLGQMIAAGAPLGSLEPRLSPSDKLTVEAQRVSLQTQLATARADQTAAQAAQAAAQAAFDRLRTLNAQQKNVSDRSVEEAQAKLKAETAHVQGAAKTVELVTVALAAAQARMEPVQLSAERGGEVADVQVQPGEAVESGQVLLRLVRFDHLVAHVDIPADEPLHEPVSAVRVLPMGRESQPLVGTPMGVAAAVDPRTHGKIALFRVAAGGDLRPGTPAVVYLPAGGAALQGVTIPRAAVVRHNGTAWVYIAEEAGQFQRRAVALDHPVADGWFVTEGFKSGETIVTVGAQSLLSAEVNAVGGGAE